MTTVPSARGGRGGRRQGTPGTSYSNRTDLNQTPRAVPGQTYGEAGAQIAAQQAVPMAGPGTQPAPQSPMPGPLTSPTSRPNEPLTAGIPTGPGPGPESLLGAGTSQGDIDAEALLRSIYRANPNSDIARLLATYDAQRT